MSLSLSTQKHGSTGGGHGSRGEHGSTGGGMHERSGSPEDGISRPHDAAGGGGGTGGGVPRRSRRAASVAVACLCLAATFAALASVRGDPPLRHEHERGGPLHSDHIISHQPADDCNYVGAPDPQPGDVWMDETPSGFLLTYSHEGYWLPMCAIQFSTPGASVACRMLGYQGASVHYNSQLHNTSILGLAPGAVCTGQETSLAMCGQDPDFEQSWSDCRKYPESMAVRLTCYGDIASRRENHYELGDKFSDDLKTAVRRCGSSQVLTGLIEEINEKMATSDGSIHFGNVFHASHESVGAAATSSSNSDQLGKILGPVIGGLAVIGTTAGAAAGSGGARHSVGSQPSPSSQPLGGSQQASQPGWSSSLVADLRELASMRGEGLLSEQEFDLAKSRLLEARR
ncbi:hypothetical protein T492DRAFT_844149 [Pavlovales sp. CCMP2436]|nr:hypothetical protein T492DRAFT_844149 [Pavlovales sp. CCMP2436]